MIKINSKIKNLSLLPSETKREPELKHQKSYSTPNKIIFTSIHMSTKWDAGKLPLLQNYTFHLIFSTPEKEGV